MLDVQAVRSQFPILGETVHGKPLVYLDNAATMQMPRPVTEAVCAHYTLDNANVHRGVHALSQRSTEKLEQARKTVAEFIGASAPEEIILTAGTTDSINQLSRMLRPHIKPGQQILISAMEHHSNLLPWQVLCQETGAVLRIIPLDSRGDLDLSALEQQLKTPTALVSVTWVSNVLGTVNPVETVTQMAHAAGAIVCIDAAQAMKLPGVAVQKVGCDFLAFSGHKLGALTGIGVLYGKRVLLEQLSPANYGGGMLETASYEQFAPGAVPQRFEAGTPNYVGAVSLAAAIDYLGGLGLADIAEWEQYLTEKITAVLEAIPGVHVLGSPKKRMGAVSIWAEGVHSFDLGALLDAQGIAVRTGHLCAEPLANALGQKTLLRVSPAFYNTEAEIEFLGTALERSLSMLRR